jgi:NADH dehydrogenase [ubiquinone] 1 alpha subcomplex assembly factor 6
MSNHDGNLRYCIDQVKNYDYDNYLGGLLIPKRFTESYFAIRAFNIEIATIKDQSHSNTMAGRLRFQWWSDAIDEIYSKKVTSKMSHPVVSLLSSIIRDQSLSKRWFERSIEAR